ncbi:hypothetical protein A2U01_0058981, partial [Trifolium medium]|nr:hypothetical protein [Trifolium medium]
MGSDLLRKTDKGSKLILSGPIWLLQLWLNATFESKLNLFLPSNFDNAVSTRQIEGTRLALLRQRNAGLSSRELFMYYFKAFIDFDEISEQNTPFIRRQIGPTWFKKPFPA